MNETFPTTRPPMEGPEAIAIFALYGFILVIGLLVAVAISALLAWLLKQNFDALPEEHRKLKPTSRVWLLVIPFFNLYWNFVVYLALSDSYKNYFQAHGVTDVGDCAREIGKWYCIAAVCSLVPCVQYVSGPAALVLLIIYLVKVFELKKRVASPPSGTGALVS